MEMTAFGIARVIYQAVVATERAGSTVSVAAIGDDQGTFRSPDFDSLAQADQDAIVRAVAGAAGSSDTAPISEAIGRCYPLILIPSLVDCEHSLIAAVLDALSPGDLPRFASPAYEHLAADGREQYQQQRQAMAALAHYAAGPEESWTKPGAPHEWAFVPRFDYGQASVLTVRDTATGEPRELRVHWTPPGHPTATSQDLADHARRHIGATRETVAANPGLSSPISFGESGAVQAPDQSAGLRQFAAEHSGLPYVWGNGEPLLPPGMTRAANLTGEPETVLTTDQAAAMSPDYRQVIYPGTWTPEATERFKREWDHMNRDGSAAANWLPARIIERKPQIGDRVHYVTDRTARDRPACCAATILGLGQVEVNEQNPDGDGIYRQTANLIVMPNETGHITWEHGILFVPGTYSAGERTFVPGEPMPVITCDDLSFAPGTWHWA